MNYRPLAADFDARDLPVEATWAYELAIRSEESDQAVYVNLIAIYFECQDPGYSAYHHIDPHFVDAAFHRFGAIIAEAEHIFGAHSEVAFWRLYGKERLLYEEVSDNDYVNLATSASSLLPAFRLFVGSNGSQYRREAKRLYAETRAGLTTRERHIRGVLESNSISNPLER